MKRGLVKIALALLSWVWLTNGNCFGSEDGKMAVFQMSDKEETCIQIKAGQLFSLKFATRPGTGYAWVLASTIDESMLAILGKKHLDPDNGLLGGSGWEIWLCRARAAGQAQIALHFVRPWEKDAPPIRKHVFRVCIQ